MLSERSAQLLEKSKHLPPPQKKTTYKEIKRTVVKDSEKGDVVTTGVTVAYVQQVYRQFPMESRKRKGKANSEKWLRIQQRLACRARSCHARAAVAIPVTVTHPN